MSAVVKAVKSVVNKVVDAVDKYVVEPIKNDPVTFIATVAGAYYLGPIAAGSLGTSAAVGAGVGAAIGNTGAGLAQGEDFNTAIKGGALAGVATWAGAELATPKVDASALQKGITGQASQGALTSYGSTAGTTTGTTAGTTAGSATSSNLGSTLASGADDVLAYSAGPNTGGSWTSLADDAVSNFGDDITANADEFFDAATAKAQGLKPDGYGGYTSAPGPVTTQPAPLTSLKGDLTSGAGSLVDDTTGGVYTPKGATEGSLYDDILTNKNLDMPSYNNPLGGGQGFNTAKIGAPDLVSKYPTAIDAYSQTPSLWDKATNYASGAWDWAKQNPYYSIPLAVGAYGLTEKYLGDKGGPENTNYDSKEQIGESSFYDPMQLLAMRRSQIENDLSNYGISKGEGQFFTPTVYEPIQYAQGGSVAPDKYGYYTYGQIPQTMQNFAQGGLSALARGGNFDGRSDDIPAVLSDGEFVMDAETVALLGNGSSKAGANKLEQMRQGIRKQKGGALAQGKFSPDAKNPLSYLKGRG
jgi:hypothetical protein